MTDTSFFKKYRRPLIGLGIVVVIVGIVLSYLGWANGIKNEGARQQNNIMQLRRNMGIEISTCLDKGSTAAQVAMQQNASLKDTLTSIVQARYVDAGGNAAGADNALRGGALVSALQENYPQIDQSSWKVLMGVVVGCREDVRDAQDRLQHDATAFQTWTMTGSIFQKFIRDDFPNDTLTVSDGKSVLKGSDALKFLIEPIILDDAKKALESGQLPQQQLFPSATPQPTR